MLDFFSDVAWGPLWCIARFVELPTGRAFVMIPPRLFLFIKSFLDPCRCLRLLLKARRGDPNGQEEAGDR